MKSLTSNTVCYPYATLVTVSIVVLLFCTLLADYYLGKTFATALSAGFFTILLCIYMALTKKLLFPKIPSILFLGFILWSILTTFFSVDITNSMWEDIRLVAFFLLFLLSYNVISVHKTSLLFLKTFVFMGSVLIVFELAFYFVSGQFQDQGNLRGFFSWHNQMAGFLLYLVPSLVTFLLYIKNKSYRIVFGLSLLISLSAMIFTYSRGGWIILIIQLFTVFILTGKVTKKYILLVLSVLLILFSVSLQFQPTLFQKLASVPQELTSQRTVSGNFRVSTWTTSFEILKHFPLFGVGPDGFGSLYASFQSLPWLYARNAHNHLLQIAVESGVIGFLLFLSFLISFVRIIKEKLSTISSDKKVLFVGILTSLVGSFLHSLIDYDFSTIVLFAFFSLFLGVALGMLLVKNYVIRLVGFQRVLYLYLFLFLLFVGVLEVSEDAYISAKYQYAEGEIADAKESLSTALRFNPYRGEAYNLASEIFYTTNEYEKAKQFAHVTTLLLPYENRQYSVLGAIATSEKKYKEAITFYTKAVQLRPYADPNLYRDLADSYYRNGDREKAEKLLENAINKRFPLNETYKGFEYIYFATGLTNNLAALYVMLGQMKLEQGKTEEAEKLFQTVKKELTIPKSALQLKPTDMLE